MTRRMRLAGRLLTGLYMAGVGFAVLSAPTAAERVIRLYLGGFPWSMLSFGMFSFAPGIDAPATVAGQLLSLLGWCLMALSVLLNGVIAFALGAFVAEPRGPKTSTRAG